MDPDSLIFDFIWESEHIQPEDLLVDDFVTDLFALLKVTDVELSVLVTGDTHMRELNQNYRQLDKTTDVLSFPSGAVQAPDQPRHLGDIVISYDQALRQSEEIGQPFDCEIRFLILHGVLHLLGYDHETDNGEMIEYQTQVKLKLNKYFSAG